MHAPAILIIHGPNLNLLGTREPEIYGHMTLDDINKAITELSGKLNIKTKIFQSNSEGNIIGLIQENRECSGLVINPGAYTHTSIAIADAIKGTGIPAVEVHLSNIHSREDYRKKSFIAPVCIGQISGFGYFSYLTGIEALHNYLTNLKTSGK
ncbi:MAG: type II 3-dehydroquinate dehydratase [Spirochaetes bacterium]|nr:type II 3-dehydroquinate dehydratase [Spirochaetota bacterium]